jgi:hypothetical protein
LNFDILTVGNSEFGKLAQRRASAALPSYLSLKAVFLA